MRKKVLLIIALFCFCASGSWADEVTGSWTDYRDTDWGTDYASASSFTVSTAAQLAQLAYMVNEEHKDFSGKTVTQTDNIDLGGHYWMPIGHYSGDQIFAGTFDGAGKTISGMHIKITNNLYIGLFGHFKYDESSSNKITGVTLANSTIEGKGLVGGIVGENNGLIEDCHVLSDVRIYFSQKSVTNFGGIAGQNFNSSSSEKAAIIRYCSSQVEINNNGFIDEQGETGSRRCGGIVGYSSTNSSVYGSLYIGNSIAGDYSIGAIVGDNDSEHGASLERNYYLTRNVNLKGVGIVNVLVGEDAAGAKPAKKLTFQDDVTITDKEYDGIMKIYSGYHDAFCLLYNGVYYSGQGDGVYLTHASPAAGYSYEFTCSDPTVTSEDYKGKIFFKIGESDCTFGFSTEKAFDGDGTEDSPYLIQSVSDMNKLSQTTNGCLQVNWEDCYFALTDDLTFDGTTNNFTPISSCFGSDDLGYKGSEFSYFAGHFDGNGHTIEGLNQEFNLSEDWNFGIGLFGRIKGGSVKNLCITNSTFKGYEYYGAVAGELINGTVENCHVANTVSIQPVLGEAVQYVGGIVGYVKDDSFVNGCTVFATIESPTGGNSVQRMGGIAGSVSSSIIQHCLFAGTLDTPSCNFSSVGSLFGGGDATFDGNLYDRNATSVPAVGTNYNINTLGRDCEGAKAAYILTMNDPVYLGETLGEFIAIDNDEIESYPPCGHINTALSAYVGLIYYNGYYVEPGASITLKTDNPYRASFNVETADMTGNTFTMPAANATAYATNIARREWGGSGTQADPFTISNVAGLNALADEVNSSALGTPCFSGQYFKLTDDIDYSEVPVFANFSSNFTPIGYFQSNQDMKTFNGNFDGDGHTISGITLGEASVKTLGIFGCMWGDTTPASVRNLKLTNSNFTVSAEGQIVGGIAAVAVGPNTFDNCSVTGVTFNIVEDNKTEGALGGIVGLASGSLVQVSNCFCEAQYTNEVEQGDYIYPKKCYYNGAIVGHNDGITLATNYYHRTTAGVGGIGKADSHNGEDVEGAQAVFTFGIAPVEGGTTTLVEPIPAPTIVHNGTNYYLGGTEFQLACTTDNPQYGYILSNVDENDVVTLNADLIITTTINESVYPGHGTETAPYLIWSKAQMNKLAQDIKGNDWEKTIGKHFKLMVDLEYDYDEENNYVPVGYLQLGSLNERSHYFGGIFDGDGHTISGVRVASSASYHPVGIFGMVYNGSVKNLTVEHSKFEKVGGTVIDFGPIAGAVEESASLIQNCHVGDDVMISIDNQHYAQNSGGIVGRMNGGTVKGCTSKAWWQVLDTSYNPDLGITPQPTRFGCIAGSVVNAAISDCLYYNDQQLMLNIYTGGIVTDNQSSTIERSYFTCTPNDGKAWRIDFPDENFTVNEAVEPAYESSKMKTWEQGILFRGSLYLLKDQTATLTCNDTKYLNGNALAEGVEIVSYQEGIQLDGTGASISSPQAKSTSVTMGSTNACVVASSVLDAGADNTAKIASLSAAGSLNVTLRNLNLYADNAWNTICLPFEVELQSSEGKGNIIDCAFQNAIVKELTSSSFADGTLTLNFSEVTDRMQAGKPYLIKWTNSEYYSNRWQNPVFLTPDMSNPDELTSTTVNATFTGTFSPVTLMGGDRSVLYIGGGNNLYFPAADRTMNAFRAYFLLNLDASNEVKAFVLNFDEDNADGINSLTFEEDEMINGKSSNGKWYDLSGRKLSGQPCKGGIYIVNGKKVLY